MSTPGPRPLGILLLSGAGIAVSLAVTLVLALDYGPLAVSTSPHRSGDGLRGSGAAMLMLVACLVTLPGIVAAWSLHGSVGQGLLVAVVACFGGLFAALFGFDLVLSEVLPMQLLGLLLVLLAAAAPALLIGWSLRAKPGDRRGGRLGPVLAGLFVVLLVVAAWAAGVI